MRNLLSSTLLLCLATAMAPAGVIIAPGPFTATDTVNWSQLGPDGTTLPSSFNALSALNQSISVQLTGANGLTSVVCDPITPVNCSWAPPATGYNIGNTLIWAEDLNGAGSAPITFLFPAQFNAGLYLQPASSGPFSVLVQAFNGATLLASGTVTSEGTGNPVFAGALSNQQNITSLVLSLNSCGAFQCDPNDFSVNTLRLGSVLVVPEPATLSIVGIGLIFAAGLRKRMSSSRRNG